MITLINGSPQNASGIIVPHGSVVFQLNVDAQVITAPYGQVSSELEIVFQFDANGQIQPNAPATSAQIYSNAELNPSRPYFLATYYFVTFYDANGARLNKRPMWWQFPQGSGATIDIGKMIAFSTVGGNVIFYPTLFVTSVTFTGDGTIFSTVPSPAVTSTGTLTPTLLKQAANRILAGPASGSDDLPTWRALVAADIPPTTRTAAIQYVIDGGGATPTTGAWGQIQIPYACTITSVTLTADQSGSAVVDLLKSSYSGFPGSLTSITASAQPTLSSAQKETDATLTGWTKTFAAGDILQFSLSSVTTCTRLNLTINLSVVQ